jgi:hypothetical protein
VACLPQACLPHSGFLLILACASSPATLWLACPRLACREAACSYSPRSGLAFFQTLILLALHTPSAA